MEMAFIVLLEKTKAMEFLSSIPGDLYSHKNVWLVQMKVADIGSVYFPIDSQVYMFNRAPEKITIQEVYSIDQGLEQIARNLGSWSEARKEMRLSVDPMPFFERRKTR